MTAELLFEKINMPAEAVAAFNNFLISDGEYAEGRKLFYSDEEKFYAWIKTRHQADFYLAVMCWYIRFAVDLYGEYVSKGFTDDIYFDTFSDLRVWQKNCMKETGLMGIRETCWLTAHMHGQIYKLGRLQFQPDELEEPLTFNGETVNAGERVYNIHVQEGGPLLPDEIQESFYLAKKYLGERLVLLISSWLTDPTLKELLSEDSNILKFQELFYIYDKEESRSIERYVFGEIKQDPDEYLPQGRFASAVKERILRGETFYEGKGIKII